MLSDHSFLFSFFVATIRSLVIRLFGLQLIPQKSGRGYYPHHRRIRDGNKMEERSLKSEQDHVEEYTVDEGEREGQDKDNAEDMN